jgi:hypothetical protein
MELTAAAEARVRAAIAQASAEAETIRHRRTDVVQGVKRFASAWEALAPEARQWIQAELAEQAGDVEPADLDPGAAAHALLDESAGKQGERLASIPVKVAVCELFAAYVEGGGKPEIGNRAHRSREERPPHPACTFIAENLLRLFPGTFGMDIRTAERRADTYLHELARGGQLGSRKKPAE